MAKTITEKFIDGKLVERVTVEDAPGGSITTPYEWRPYPYWLNPWWSITPQPYYGPYVNYISFSNFAIPT